MGPIAFRTGPQPKSTVKLNEDNRDSNGVGGQMKRRYQAQGKSYEIYPWGSNNLLPNEMIDLYRTNGDVMNLVQARIDFMYGMGPGWFQHKPDGNDLILIPYEDNATKEFGDLNDVPDLVDAMLSFYNESGNAFVNLSSEAGLLLLSMKDSLTVRAASATAGYVDTWLLASDWRNAKKIVAVPAWTPANNEKAPETIYQLKPKQTGQFYYGFARWWAAQKWIKLANRVPDFHNTGLDTEYNATRICRIASDFFEKYGGETDEDRDVFKGKFYEEIEGLLFGGEGTNRVIFDECALGVDGKLIPWLEFADIKRQLTGKEYTEMYDTSVRAFANASGILAGLAGVSDGKMLGGSGSELRVSAEYQQFYRTPRDRQAVQSFFDRVVKPRMKLPHNVYFGFKNILLETLDKGTGGSSQKITSAGGTSAKKADKTPKTDAPDGN